MKGSIFLIVLVLFIGIALFYAGITGRATKLIEAVTG